MANTLDWTKIFKDTNFPAIPDMTPIKYIGEREREEFDANALEEEIDDIKDNNELIQFMNVMSQFLPWFDLTTMPTTTTTTTATSTWEDLFTWQAQRMSNYL